MSKKSIRTRIDLKTLADELRKTAAQLEQGVIQIDGDSVTIGEPLFLKTKQKIKDDQASFTLAFKVPLKASTAATQESLPALPENDRIRPLRSEHPGSPPAVKQTKKEISRLWKECTGLINKNAVPAAAERRRLLAACEDYQLFVEPAWAAAWQNCRGAVRQCLEAAAAGDFAKARALATDVNLQTKACHKLYK